MLIKKGISYFHVNMNRQDVLTMDMLWSDRTKKKG